MIELKNVSAGYEGKDVLLGLDLSIPQGENLAIIGPNGCGKTTLLRCMAGTLPYRGSILIEGEEVSRMKPRVLARKVAMLSQMSAVYFNYTVLETVLMGRYVHAKGFMAGVSQADRAAAQAALETTGMWDCANREVDTLSGGQLQRVFLAKVLAQNPQIILLDEPTNHLDLSYQVELIRFLRTWSNQPGKAAVGVLHDINLAVVLSEKLLLMDQGSLVANGPAAEVLGGEALKKAYKMDVSQYMVDTLRYWEGLGK